MEFKQRVVLGIVAVAGFAYFSAEKIERDEVSYSTTSEVEILAEKDRAEKGFELAESELEESIKPDNEPDEQTCDGSGWITHGDGHRTPCPGCSKCKPKKEPSHEESRGDVCGCGCNKQGCDCQKKRR